jgi:hypothetical protein
MTKKLSTIMLFLAAILNITCASFQVEKEDLRGFVNYWWEPLYEQVDQGQLLESSYGYLCVSIQDDGMAYMKSEVYGVEGPYDWCINEDGSITIDEYEAQVEPVGNREYHIKVKTGVVPIEGTVVECYSDSFNDEELYEGSMESFAC